MIGFGRHFLAVPGQDLTSMWCLKCQDSYSFPSTLLSTGLLRFESAQKSQNVLEMRAFNYVEHSLAYCHQW